MSTLFILLFGLVVVQYDDDSGSFFFSDPRMTDASFSMASPSIAAFCKLSDSDTSSASISGAFSWTIAHSEEASVKVQLVVSGMLIVLLLGDVALLKENAG